MIKINKYKIITLASLLAIISTLIYFIFSENSNQKYTESKVVLGNIERVISTVGTVNPQNRLEIKPPINGRIERILVKEGDDVKIGDILAFMSSNERATLIDAARLQGKTELEYWQKAYRETPIVAPIDGEIIVRDVEPGQIVTASDAVLVISDRLIVQADVDETDIGDVRIGQKAIIGLDAYPNVTAEAVIDHISYESQIVNNVTIYKVDVVPETVPNVFRSGMSANVEILVEEKENVLLVPADTLIFENNETKVIIRNPTNNKIEKVLVKTGLQRKGYVEIISELKNGMTILIPEKQDISTDKNTGLNPLMPGRRR